MAAAKSSFAGRSATTSTGCELGESGPGPMALIAWTVKVY